MKLVVIIPALNEEKTIGAVLSEIPSRIEGITEIEILVVDDGSTDSTRSIAEGSGATVISHRRRQGVGAAFHTGIRGALLRGADVIVNVDADGQFNPEDMRGLIAPVLDGRAGFVTGSRFAKRAWRPDMPNIKAWGNRWVTRLVNTITGQTFTDVSCGFRAYSRDAALRMSLFGRFTYTQEAFIDLAFKNVEILEIPIQLVEGQRKHGRSRVYLNPWHYAMKSATIMFRTARDYLPFYFIGLPGLIILGAGILCALFVLIHFLQTGQTHPYRSLVPISGAVVVVGVVFLLVSFLADMLHRNRMLLEEQLYHLRQDAYRKKQS